jgi:hypothetical protein
MAFPCLQGHDKHVDQGVIVPVFHMRVVYLLKRVVVFHISGVHHTFISRRHSCICGHHPPCLEILNVPVIVTSPISHGYRLSHLFAKTFVW